MKRTVLSSAQRGFTLIELLLVAIILGILAAVVVPQFSSNTTDTKNQALKSNLSAIRAAIDLYATQHEGKFPAQNKSSDGTSAGTTFAEADFVNQMTKYSDKNGKTADAKNEAATPPITFGPYLRSVPVEPISGSAAVAPKDGNLSTAPDGTAGWFYVPPVGRFVKNSPDTAVDSAGVKYNTY